jgi:hypothetical protein
MSKIIAFFKAFFTWLKGEEGKVVSDVNSVKSDVNAEKQKIAGDVNAVKNIIK